MKIAKKNRWGGKSADDDLEMTAAVTKSNVLNMKVDIKLRLSEKKAGKMGEVEKVLYMLHDSYLPDMIREVSDAGSGFECAFSAFEAFTVGAVVVLKNNTVLKYELDLNKVENIPDEFRYDRILPTISEVEAELSSLSL